ncbi:MAG: carbohydrate kinase [Spirochaetales bacterium]|nr:carbohydrate kinase [Spirochaetales bacterium]
MIITIGEALIDFIYIDEGSSQVYKPVPGGSPMNTAVALSRLDVPTAFISGISTDMFGKMLTKHLSGNGVDISAAIPKDNPTTLAFAKIVKGKAEYAFFANGSADRSITELEIASSIDKLSAEPSCFQIGSISLLMEPGASGIYNFIRTRNALVPVSFDPNIRPSLVEDGESYIERLEALFRLSDIVKISDEDLEWMFPDLSFESAAAEILKYGVSVCVVTAGKNGVHWFSHGIHEFLAARDITITDTIGAGDTFHAGLLAFFYWSGNLTREKLKSITPETAVTALKYASTAAEINCCRQGTNPPQAAELAKELADIFGIDILALFQR